ncbi:MAG TPA: ABC transporter permease [Candidatus Binataceae bacterium]|nr:ABC transporter permease [Candidatus Binataceae bacterium]
MLRTLGNIFWLGIKELFSLGRDGALVFLIIFSMTHFVYSPAKEVKMDVDHASIAVVDEDHSLLSRHILQAFMPPLFRRAAEIPVEQIDDAMDRGRYTFVIDIPPNFERDFKHGRSPAIQVNVDATAMSEAGRGAIYIQEILAREASYAIHRTEKTDQPPPFNVVVRGKFNPNFTFAWFISVMQVVNSVTMLALFLAGAAVIREREHGTLEHLLAMPLRPSEIMLAKICSNSLVIVVAAVLSLVLVIKGVLGVPIAGSLMLFAGGVAIYLFSITSLSIMIATQVSSMPQFGLLALPAFIVLSLLSGSMTPFESMPENLQRVMQFAPSTHFVSFAQAVLYRGAGFDLVWKDCAMIAALGLVFFAVALLRFRQMLVQIQA